MRCGPRERIAESGEMHGERRQHVVTQRVAGIAGIGVGFVVDPAQIAGARILLELRTQEVTGVFQADDPGSFLIFLSRIPGVTVQQSADHSRFVVTQQTQGATP